jgi:hypothetical protein
MKESSMERYISPIRIMVMMIFISGMSIPGYNQEVRVTHGIYDTIEKEKQLVTLLNKMPAYVSAKMERPVIAEFERWVSNQFLDYTLYLPSDSFELHPLVIFMNGGGLLFSEKDDRTMELLGERLTKAGIGFMAIGYRTEILSLLSVNQAGYLAIQDFHEAIRYAKSIAQDHKFSRDHIYIGGIGCGAVTALHTAALQEDEIDYEKFAMYDEKFGCLECGGQSHYDSEVRGVINLSGGITDLEILKDEDFKLLQFYGTEDQVISCNYAKPYSEVLGNSFGFRGSSLDIRNKISDDLYRFMDVPELHGALSIEENKALYPEVSISTFSFPNYGHQLLMSKKNNRSMMPANTIINEIEDFVKSDLKPEVSSIIMPSKSEVNKEIILKGPEAKKYKWFWDGAMISEGKTPKIKYRLSEEGDHEIGLMIQNEFGVWSEMMIKPINVLPEKTITEQMAALSKNPWPWIGIVAGIGMFIFLFMRKKRNNRSFIN